MVKKWLKKLKRPSKIVEIQLYGKDYRRYVNIIRRIVNNENKCYYSYCLVSIKKGFIELDYNKMTNHKKHLFSLKYIDDEDLLYDFFAGIAIKKGMNFTSIEFVSNTLCLSRDAGGLGGTPSQSPIPSIKCSTPPFGIFH